jgi:hypothetical protein
VSAGKVDVLAVMDRIVREVPMGSGQIRAIVEASAAVAELIAAVDGITDDCNCSFQGCGGRGPCQRDRHNSSQERLAAAMRGVR